MGRHKKPVELKIAQGNPGKRKLPKKKKEVEVDLNFAPDILLEGYAKEYWDKLHDRLKTQGVLKITDTMELTMLAYYCGKFRELSDQLKGEEISCMSDKGNAYQNPLWGALNTCQDKIQKMLIQFGMTPAARADVFEELEQPENPFLEFSK